MASIREQILQSLTTTLAATSGVRAVYRSRAEAFGRSEAPVLSFSLAPGVRSVTAPASCTTRSTLR